ncbi:MAG: hypothetical protein IH991_04030, partial [Planctomycetes bacterium]|nr:hypothetical protein [Planctomycetota bacterium]
NTEVLELITKQLELPEGRGDVSLLYVLGFTTETLLQAGIITEDQAKMYAKLLSSASEKLIKAPSSLSDAEFERFVEMLRRAGYTDNEVVTPDVEEVMDYWKRSNEQYVSTIEIFQLKQVVNRLSKDQRAAIARRIIDTATSRVTERQLFRYHPRITWQDDVKELPTLGVEIEGPEALQRLQDSGILELARAFDEVGDVMDGKEVTRALEKISDGLRKSPRERELLGLVKMIIKIAPKTEPRIAHAAAVTIAKRFGTLGVYDHVTYVHGFRALAKRLTAAELIEFLKWPTCIGWQRGVIVEELASKRHFDQDFADVWELVDWVKKNKKELDLLTPPKRPK